MHKACHRKLADSLQNRESTIDICLNYGRRFVNAPVDMGLCRKMNNRVAATHRCFQNGSIADIASHKCVMGITSDRLKIRQVPCICQLVVIDDPNAPACFKNVADKVGTDESRTTSH